MRAPLQPLDDLGRGFLAGKLAEILFDVLDFERALFELVLCNVVFHVDQPRCSIFAHVSRSDTVRLKTSPFGDESGSTQKYPSRSNCRRSGTLTDATLGSA